MTTAVHDDTALTTHAELLAWVRDSATMTGAAEIEWCDGSAEEWTRITDLLVESGTFTRLNPAIKPNSFWCASDPSDVARVENQTFICSATRGDAGPTNNWMDPAEMKTLLTTHLTGSMRGRTLYVIPYCMGPLTAAEPKLGVQLTDSPYVVASMHVMTRMGTSALDLFGDDAPFVAGLHSVGAPLAADQVDVPWPCNDTKYIVHFPEERLIWSYGSGYGGNALLGKKCHSLRIASFQARDEGWLAEHMLIAKLTSPAAKVHYVAAAFPSACGKTNLAMLDPTLPGWTLQTLGDDIAWLRVGADGRLFAVNPEAGFFGVAPGTGWSTNPNAMRTIEQGNSIFTNVALTDDGDVWWEGMTDTVPTHLTDWKGRDWTPDSPEPAAHPNSRFCTPIAQCPIVAPEYDDPDGVPIDAIFFGGRRRSTIPLIVEARDWQHGVFLGSTLSSETTAAATGAVGVVRRDPMAMLPFIGYNVGDYLAHWLALGRSSQAALPKIFQVNWFRRDANGTFLWPGFGENLRVLAWALGRVDGTASARLTPIGLVPSPGELDLAGIELTSEQLEEALSVDRQAWTDEAAEIRTWFTTIGDRLPAQLNDELDELLAGLAT
jgi:phosphoenolpyruvate carboxykinase (GTP)